MTSALTHSRRQMGGFYAPRCCRLIRCCTRKAERLFFISKNFVSVPKTFLPSRLKFFAINLSHAPFIYLAQRSGAGFLCPLSLFSAALSFRPILLPPSATGRGGSNCCPKFPYQTRVTAFQTALSFFLLFRRLNGPISSGSDRGRKGSTSFPPPFLTSPTTFQLQTHLSWTQVFRKGEWPHAVSRLSPTERQQQEEGGEDKDLFIIS